MFDFIQEYFYVGIGMASVETIDRVNILQASFFSYEECLNGFKKEYSEQSSENQFILLIDGNQLLPSFSGAQEALVAGDSHGEEYCSSQYYCESYSGPYV